MKTCCEKFDTCTLDCISRLHWHDERRTALPEERRITGMPLIKRLKTQRDECATVLRELVAVVERNLPMPAGVRENSPLGRAHKILSEVPSYEQQLRNLAEGIGMTYEALIAALDEQRQPQSERS